MKYITTVNDKTYEIEIAQEGQVLVDGVPRAIDFHRGRAYGVFSLIIDHQSYETIVEERDGTYHVLITGNLYEVSVTDERAQRLAHASGALGAGSGEILMKSPMPGLIVAVAVEEGQEVEEGQTVIILESMKMQNELKAPRAGTIGRVSVAAGNNVEQGKPLITII